MSLKADRRHVDSDIAHFMNATATRGGIVSVTATISSGAAMDQSESTVAYAAEPSGVEPLGILMSDVVNLDLTRQHMNWHKEEVQLGGKVTVWTKCTVVTDTLFPGITPTPGQVAYVAHSGFISNADEAIDSGQENTSLTRVVGRFITGKNADGYAKIDINLP